MRSLGLLSVAHAINHAQAVVLPLIFLKIIDEFGVGVETIAFLAAIGAFLAGIGPAQLRRLDPGRLAPAAARLRRASCSVAGSRSRRSRRASRRSPSRTSPRGSAVRRSTRSATGCWPSSSRRNDAGSRSAPTSRAATSGRSWSRSSASRSSPRSAGAGPPIVFGLPAIAIAILILLFVRERGTDRAAAVASGTVRAAFGRILRDRDLRWLYLTSALGGGGRGLGVVNLFALIYMTRVLGLDEGTAGLMYGVLIVFSVPVPIVAGWLSDRVGRKPLIVGVYLGGALGFVVFLAAGSSLLWLWVGIVLMGLFTFAESPQLQALLGDIAPPSTRDASYAVYFAMAFGVGSLWVIVYGLVIEAFGEAQGVPIVFGLMAVTFVLAALGTLPIHAEQRARENAAFEATLG